jgi:hypothetical protein
MDRLELASKLMAGITMVEIAPFFYRIRVASLPSAIARGLAFEGTFDELWVEY